MLRAKQERAAKAVTNAVFAYRREETLGSEWISEGWRVAGGEAFRSGRSDDTFIVLTHDDPEVVSEVNRRVPRTKELPPGVDTSRFVYIEK